MRMIDYLEKTVSRVPDKTALVDMNRSLTYLQMKQEIDAVATGLLKSGKLGYNEPVAVFVGRNVESVCAVLAVSKTRNFYVPIDGSQPANRIHVILGQMQPKVVLALDEVREDIRDAITDCGATVYMYNELKETPVDDALLTQIRDEALSTDPIYAICTSGSTGVPKGVVKAHYSVLDFIPVFVETFGLTEDDIFANQAPFDFDVSGKDIYSCLYLGATLYVVPQKLFSSPKKLIAELNEQHVTVLIWAVSALCVAAGMNAFSYETPKYVRRVMFSGEVMPIKMLHTWQEAVPECKFVNLYGPTEVTNNCTYYIVDREFDLTERLPLGKPFKNQQVLYLNAENKPIGIGEQGEICVVGSSIALGYYRNPERTAESFVQNPLCEGYAERMYRTGDIAELREDGHYYFAGRKDFQIKHMGHRIELEEVEVYLNAVDGVERAGCLFDKERGKIVCFYSGKIDKRDIAKALMKELPKYMLPNIYFKLDQLALNKNGKIDRGRLRELYQEAGE